MVLPTLILFLSLCLYGMSADSGKTFVMHRDHAPGSSLQSAVVINGKSGKLSCHAACARRSECLAFSVCAASTCTLYDTFVDDPEEQVNPEPGSVFFNLAVQKVSLETAEWNSHNGGCANLFPQLHTKRAGRVLRWQVRCASAGMVYLAIWRSQNSDSFILIGKHSVTVPDGMEHQLVTYDVPAADSVLVKAGDFVGLHNVDGKNRANVKFYVDDTGANIGKGYFLCETNDRLPVGFTVPIDELGSHYRIPAITLYTT